jgi:hypothetical protein
MRWRVLAGAAGAAGALVAAAELLERAVPIPLAARSARRVGVVVLGYPARRDGTAHAVARWRVATAVALARRLDAAVVVMSGGATRQRVVEADVMVDVAKQLGLDETRLRAERRSTNTWENVRESAPLVDDCDVVLVVSDPMHAKRACKHWRAQFPDDAGRVFAAGERRPFERWWLVAPCAYYECALAVHDRVRFRRRVSRA